MVRLVRVFVCLALVVAIIPLGCASEPTLSGELTIVDDSQSTELVLGDGAAVTVPPYSLPVGSTMSMRKLDPTEAPPLPEGFDDVGALYDISVDQPIETTVTLRIPLPEVTDESVFQFSRYYDAQWLPTSYVVHDNCAIVDTDALSIWGWLGADYPEATYEEMYIDSIHPDYGAGGTVVTITGESLKPFMLFRHLNFGGVTIVEDDTISWTNNEIVVKAPSRSRDILGRPRLRDNTVEVSIGPAPRSNPVEFTYKEPVLNSVEPKSGEPSDTVILTGEHFGDGKYSAVRFGASRTPVVRWEDSEIVVEAPDDFGIGLKGVGDAANMAMTGIAIVSQSLFSAAIALLDEATPDVDLYELEWNEDDPLHVQFSVVVQALVWEVVPFVTITVKPSGDLVVPVTVETGVGGTETHFFTFTPSFEQEEPVYFPDANLEAAIREAIEKPTGDIYTSDLQGLTRLVAGVRNIVDLTGLEHCINLTVLSLWSNQISDISPLGNLTNLTALTLDLNQISDVSPLQSLTNLTVLNLDSNQISNIVPLANLANLTQLCLGLNRIVDLSALVGLTRLGNLHLGGNKISDISPLRRLTDLEVLWLGYNEISDVSPLSNLTNLKLLELHHNEIANISPLSGLTSLREVSLSTNQISDVSALVENVGLGDGDSVDLRWNPLSEQSINEYIPALQARGVTVWY